MKSVTPHRYRTVITLGRLAAEVSGHRRFPMFVAIVGDGARLNTACRVSVCRRSPTACAADYGGRRGRGSGCPITRRGRP